MVISVCILPSSQFHRANFVRRVPHMCWMGGKHIVFFLYFTFPLSESISQILSVYFGLFSRFRIHISNLFVLSI